MVQQDPGQPEDGDLETVAARTGHRFARTDLLRKALTHPSAASKPNSSYERLEFLGDRVLGLIVADLLLTHFPQEAEGALAKRLAALVRRETLAGVARDLGLARYLIVAKAEQEAGEAENPALLADACEAIIGALFLDGGLEAARRFLVPLWTPLLEADLQPPQDSKTTLQEWAQGRGLPLPAYREVRREGPPHEPLFTVEVSIKGHPVMEGEGRSKRFAEQMAAERLLALVEGGQQP